MRQFFFFSLLYLLAGIVLILLVREDPVMQLQFILLKSISLGMALIGYVKYLGVFLIVGLYFTRHLGLKQRIIPTVYAIMGCMIFSGAFSLVKTSIPSVVPFYADAMLANLDAALHFGVAPWTFTHGLSDIIPANLIVLFYFGIWTLPAIFLPVIIAITDTDTERTKRFLILHVVCWIGLGNVVATLFSSVGPVYYDRLLGGDRFAGLTTALANSGMSDTRLGVVQDGLWTQLTENGQSIGSGISAFPSVHVGVATVFALYLAERSRALMPVGIAFLGIIVFASVYNGWHYAVDGYASIALILAAWAVQQRRNVAFASYKPA
ncbi:phosphatase PAP2 family protein [Litoreibacter sp.]|nr:phosphatase PAP2 family protein [Litoreibacter sp.]